jgi:hypothetical protein
MARTFGIGFAGGGAVARAVYPLEPYAGACIERIIGETLVAGGWALA